MDISSNVVNSSISLYLFMSMLHVKKRLDEIDCFNIHIKKKGGGKLIMIIISVMVVINKMGEFAYNT